MGRRTSLSLPSACSGARPKRPLQSMSALVLAWSLSARAPLPAGLLSLAAICSRGSTALAPLVAGQARSCRRRRKALRSSRSGAPLSGLAARASVHCSWPPLMARSCRLMRQGAGAAATGFLPAAASADGLDPAPATQLARLSRPAASRDTASAGLSICRLPMRSCCATRSSTLLLSCSACTDASRLARAPAPSRSCSLVRLALLRATRSAAGSAAQSSLASSASWPLNCGLSACAR